MNGHANVLKCSSSMINKLYYNYPQIIFQSDFLS